MDETSNMAVETEQYYGESHENGDELSGTKSASADSIVSLFTSDNYIFVEGLQLK